jgi:hypothetical protein
MDHRGASPRQAPHVTIRVSGKLFGGHIEYLDQLVQSASECRLWPLLSLSNLEEVDHAALSYLRDGENRMFGIESCPDIIRNQMNEARGQSAA